TLDVQENGSFSMRPWRIDDDDFRDGWLEESGVGGQDARLTTGHNSPTFLWLFERANPGQDVPYAPLIHRTAKQGVSSFHVVGGRPVRPGCWPAASRREDEAWIGGNGPGPFG